MVFQTSRLYHSNKGIPDSVRDQLCPRLSLSVSTTPHASDKAKHMKSLSERDRNRDNVRVELPAAVTVNPEDIFQVGVDRKGWVTELGFRVSEFVVRNGSGDYSSFDLCVQADISGRILTMYMNHEDDTHASLDERAYTGVPDETGE